MNKKMLIKYLIGLGVMQMIGASPCVAQTDSSLTAPKFDSQLLKLKVPDAFQKSSLKLEVFSDSSWQLYRGTTALSFAEALDLLGETDKKLEFEAHQKRESSLQKEFRSRRVFSIVSTLGGITYISFSRSRGWVYQIPGYAAILVASIRYLDSRKIEVEALREQYYLKSLLSPSRVQQKVDDYNFKLYQFLSTTGIQFSGS